MHARMSTLWLCGILALLLLGALWGATARLATAAPAHSPPSDTLAQKTPAPPQGGAWDDEFLGRDYLSCSDTLDAEEGSLQIKFAELLDWEQTWTHHFGSGTFEHTVAISDSVQLARVPASDEHYTTGVYTSTVFDAGRPVDWAWARWSYSGLPQGVTVEWRTLSGPGADAARSAWIPPLSGLPQWYHCAYGPTDATDCTSYLAGAASSRWVQYRATFHSEDARRTVALWDMTITYGLHYRQGTAVSIPLSPIDARSWQTVVYSAIVPSGAALEVDILDGAGDCEAPVLLAQVRPGDSLAAIDPAQHRSLRLRATLRTADPSLSPALDAWGLRWEVGGRVHLPLVLRER